MDATGQRLAAWAVVAGVILAVVGARLAFLYEPYTFLIGDCPYYAETAISILTDGDLDLRNQLKGGVEAHERQIALGASGAWHPKHPILMPLLTVPLLPLFGMNSFLLFNVIVLVALAVTLCELAALAARRSSAAAGALATVLGSFLILYDYNYSPDLFAGLLLALAVLAAFRDRMAVSGLMAGLAAFARTSNLLILPILFGYALWKRKVKGAALFSVMMALPLLAQGGLNWWMFGSPFTSPYTRIIVLAGDQIAVRSHMGDFNLPIGEGIRGQILEPGKGLLWTAPILLVALPGYVLWFRRSKSQALLCFGIGEFLFLLFSRYRWWGTSHVGNRFLIPLIVLSAPAVACSVEWAIDRLRPRRGAAP